MRSTYDLGAGSAYGSVAYIQMPGDDAMVSIGFAGEFSGVTPVDGLDQEWVDVGIGFSIPISDTANWAGNTVDRSEFLGSHPAPGSCKIKLA